MSYFPSNRILLKLKYPNSTVRYFSNMAMDPGGCIVYDSTSGVTADKFWEPRLAGGQIVQDCGNLSEGIAKQTFQTVILTGDPQKRGNDGTDLLADFSSNRIEGSAVEIWYGSRSETSISNLTRVFIGSVPFTGAYSYSYKTGLVQLKIQSAITITGDLSTEVYTSGATGFPQSLEGTIKPLAFGMKNLSTSPTGFPTYAFLVGQTGTTSTVSVGGVPSSFQYEQPSAVRVNGIAVSGPSGGAPAAGQWGNWNASAGTFQIEDGGTINVEDDSIIIVDNKGLKDVTTSVVGVGDVLSSILEACGYSESTTPQADFSRSVNDSWASSLSTGFNQLYGVFPFRGQTNPVKQIDILKECMKRTGSILRINTAGNYKLEPVFPFASSSPDYTFIADDILDLKEQLDPSGEYANKTVVNGVYAHYVSDRLQRSSATDGGEVTAVGATVQQDINFQGIRVPAASGVATAINTLHSQKIIVVTSTIGPSATGILPGNRIRFDWRSVNDYLGLGHVRAVSVNLETGIHVIKSYHISNT
tara:strand:+ start:30191 stop:31780 length:1590 start_codon:yes stop_codon:yes gene_type:complete